jgi:hypothetical protein
MNRTGLFRPEWFRDCSHALDSQPWLPYFPFLPAGSIAFKKATQTSIPIRFHINVFVWFNAASFFF